jgi:hypothetical protein
LRNFGIGFPALPFCDITGSAPHSKGRPGAKNKSPLHSRILSKIRPVKKMLSLPREIVNNPFLRRVHSLCSSKTHCLECVKLMGCGQVRDLVDEVLLQDTEIEFE